MSDDPLRPVSPLPERVVTLVEHWRLFWKLADADFFSEGCD